MFVECEETSSVLVAESAEHFLDQFLRLQAVTFQVAARNPQLRIKSTIFLGRCMALKGLHAFAIEQFEKAKVEYLIMDATKKELLYSLALAYEKCGKKKEALETLKEIFSVDIAYRDVSQRIENYYKAIQEHQEQEVPGR